MRILYGKNVICKTLQYIAYFILVISIPSLRIPFRVYILLAFLTVSTMGLSNTSLGYLNYPTQVHVVHVYVSCVAVAREIKIYSHHNAQIIPIIVCYKCVKTVSTVLVYFMYSEDEPSYIVMFLCVSV